LQYSSNDATVLYHQQPVNANHVSILQDHQIDQFLAQSPSQSLGAEAIKLKHTIGSIPNFSIPDRQPTLSQHSLSVGTKTDFLIAADSYTPYSEQLNDSSPPNSLTGTAVSSRSGSPSFNNNGVDGAGLSRGFKSDPYLSAKHKTSFEHISHTAVLAQNHEPHFNPNPVHQEAPKSQFNYVNARQNIYDTSRLTAFQNQSVTLRSASGTVYPPTLNGNDDQSQPLFFVAMPSHDGRGQILRPVQMMQIPGQPNAFLVPSGKISDAPAPPPSYSEYIPRYAPVQGPADIYENVQLIHDESYGHRSTISPWSHSSSNAYHATNDLQPDPMIRIKAPLYFDDVHPADSLIDRQSKGYLYTNGSSLNIADERTGENTHLLWNQIPSIRDIIGNVKRLSRDQVGCRILQQLLDEEGSSAASLILNEGLHFWGETMVDPFGNYLFQKLLEKISAEERVILVKSISSRLVNASLNLHGTRSVQKIVELCSEDENNFLLGHSQHDKQTVTALLILSQALSSAAARLCIDSHGNHVIQKILMKLPYHYSYFIFDAVAVNVSDVARHRHGCCVIQRCLDSPESNARSHLVQKIIDKALELMQDAYGNYVVQYVLDVCSNDDVNAVCEAVVGRVNVLAIQKFSSNVLEKCLERCSERVRDLYVNELCSSDRMRELMMDPFGNYVIQRALSVSSHEQALKLVETMKPHLLGTSQGSGGIRNTAGGRRIISKICKRFPSFGLSVTSKPRSLRLPNAYDNPFPDYEGFNTLHEDRRGTVDEIYERI